MTQISKDEKNSVVSSVDKTMEASGNEHCVSAETKSPDAEAQSSETKVDM